MNVRKMTNSMLKQKVEAFGHDLYHCAKAQPKRKVHALYDEVYHPDVLKVAWLAVKSNRGNGGIDGKTIDTIKETIGEKSFLNELYQKLKTGTYQAQPVKRVHIPKGNGETRPLGIPPIEDQVVQQATKLIMEPIFDADFKNCSYGFRPKRNAHQALKVIRKESKTNYWVVDVDIKGYFDNISHEKLMKLVAMRISDKRLLTLIRQTFKDYISPRNKLFLDTLDFVEGLNRKIVGIRNYYLVTPLSKRWLAKIDWYIRDLLIIHYNTRRNKPKHRNRLVVLNLLEYKLKKLAIG